MVLFHGSASTTRSQARSSKRCSSGCRGFASLTRSDSCSPQFTYVKDRGFLLSSLHCPRCRWSTLVPSPSWALSPLLLLTRHPLSHFPRVAVSAYSIAGPCRVQVIFVKIACVSRVATETCLHALLDDALSNRQTATSTRIFLCVDSRRTGVTSLKAGEHHFFTSTPNGGTVFLVYVCVSLSLCSGWVASECGVHTTGCGICVLIFASGLCETFPCSAGNPSREQSTSSGKAPSTGPMPKVTFRGVSPSGPSGPTLPLGTCATSTQHLTALRHSRIWSPLKIAQSARRVC